MSDRFPNSGKPFRSSRYGDVRSVPVTNAGVTVVLAAGTYRLQHVADPIAPQLNNWGLYYAVGAAGFARYFPAGAGGVPSVQTCLAEFLPGSGPLVSNAISMTLPNNVVEIDVLEGQQLYLWGLIAQTIWVKISRVGLLPPRDPEVSDRER